MINVRNYDIFINNVTTLKEASKDESDNNIEYMTESMLDVIDFDGVKTDYLNSLGLTEENAKSVDSVLPTEENLVFIEFENGKMNNQKGNVKNKVRDSLLIFCDIIKVNINFTRRNATFVLVYNESKNPSSKREIKKYISNKANEEQILFGMEVFKKFYFKEVHTYTEKEFEEFLSKI